MADISRLIAPKSDQLNSDDLTTGDLTIRIREVKVLGVGKEQPIWAYYDGDNNKPWKPCKIMSRLLAGFWGPDTQGWVGKSVQLYRDPDVLWAGAKVGGIRVRAVSHISEPTLVALSESQKKRKQAMIGVLTAEVTPMRAAGHPGEGQAEQARAKAENWVGEHIGAVGVAGDLASLEALIERGKGAVAKLRAGHEDLCARVMDAYTARGNELEAIAGGFGDDDGFAEPQED